MNYYEKHIGDYIRDTVSLTMLEDGAYNRLIDQVYQSERPLPADKKEVYRLARAGSAAERKAVDYVLAKFFTAGPDGYMQKRAQAAIEEYWDREPAEQNKKENAKVRQQRSRERRKHLFDELRNRGVTPPFNASMKHLEAELSRVTERDKASDSNAPVTCDDTLTQAPSTKHQAPEVKAAAQALPEEGLEIGEICKTLRRAGINTGPDAVKAHGWATHPKLTGALLKEVVARAKQRKPLQIISVNYLSPIIDELLADAQQAEASKMVQGKDYL